MTNQNNAAQAATHEAIRRALELYADCYDTMTRIAQREGREPVVSPVSVAFDIRKNMVDAVVRALSRLRAPVADHLAARWEAMRHASNEWADMATNGIQWMRNVKDGISTPDEALRHLASDLAHCQAVYANATPASAPASAPVAGEAQPIGYIHQDTLAQLAFPMTPYREVPLYRVHRPHVEFDAKRPAGLVPIYTAAPQASEPVDDLAPAKCPITGRPFFMALEHPELGMVPTYGGPYDSYSIPYMGGEAYQPWHERELFVRRYDHDIDSWREDEEIPLRVIHEDVLNELQDAAPQASAEASEALAWYRPRSDGGYEGPIHNDSIEQVRKLSGAWVPLYAGAGDWKAALPKPQVQLSRGEHIIAVVPEYASGPGWANSPLWVYIDNQGKLRTECIQPDQQTYEQRLLFALGAQISRQLIASVEVRRKEQ